ncbi:phage tail sheath subtilisin-like domain-containing protein [Chitinispirillales bacterium ANBcel5]|uniref:phage tail sheath family protein n=1 Tax=Cellulosispirillum alkaliphilum TaxID=3039283 RepID=UPI002A5303EE|nr:phage tail sheath subtilisin-like domain-containing protein [Chitinispirillales bacterium ANBcel5]
MNYRTPGVFIEEVSSGAKPIEAVGTSTAGFIGVAPDRTKNVHKAVQIANWTQFQQEFVSEEKNSTDLSHAVFGFFQNGGSMCHIVNIGNDKTILGEGEGRKGLALFEEIDNIAIVAAPGFTDAQTYDAMLTHCERLEDRFAILDSPEKVESLRSLLKVATPDGTDGAKPRQTDRGFGGFYFPWIEITDPFDPVSTVMVPPSGHVAGIYAKTDTRRGVHKAPANVIVNGALNLAYKITHSEQSELNVNGVNCIRSFSGEGIRVWGARTLAPGAGEWRYINVRRLMTMVQRSIAASTKWVVFEPNTEVLWKSIRRNVEAFLYRLWLQGALKGTTPEQAYFVKCDNETNPQETIDAGMVVTVIGVAPAKPAEFVIFRIGQSNDGTDIS